MILWLSLHAVDYVSLAACYLMINIKKKKLVGFGYVFWNSRIIWKENICNIRTV